MQGAGNEANHSFLHPGISLHVISFIGCYNTTKAEMDL